MFYKERKRYLMVEVLQKIGAQYIGTQGEFGVFYHPHPTLLNRSSVGGPRRLEDDEFGRLQGRDHMGANK